MELSLMSRASPGAADRPQFHVAPRDGWLNDPNAPLYWKGRWHMFYQHVEAGCEWQWGLVWGHAVSEDLVTWRHLPPALRPSPHEADADGCWSGCCAVSAEGVPTILYTGVRLRSGASRLPLPPPHQDLGLLWIESQLAAVPEDPDDELLLRWRKLPQPAAALPPAGMNLTGWRDPFVYLGAQPAAAGGAGAAAEGETPPLPRQRQKQQEEVQGYRMLLGSGIKGDGGALLGYHSNGSGGTGCSGSSSLAEGWQYEGVVCSTADLAAAAAAEVAGGAPASSAAAAVHLGEVWECPLLVPLSPADGATGGGSSGGSGEQLWLLAVSPFPVVQRNSPSNPVLYWIGRLSPCGSRFDLAAASGPFRLDHGDVLYAPNVCRDANGRTLLWAWLQERRPPGTAATYAGCLSLPRQLTLSQDSRRLLQQPVPEVSQLRRSFHGQPGDGSVGSPAAGTAAVLSGSSHVSSGSGAASGAAPMVAAGFSGKGGWYAEWAEIEEGRPLEVEGLPGPQLLDLELSFRRGSASAAGLLLLSHEAGSQGNALLTYTWDTNALEILFGLPATALLPASAGTRSSAGCAPAATELHLPVPLAASSPRKQPPVAAAAAAAAAAATAAEESSPLGSPAAAALVAVDAQLAALAEPLPQSVQVEAAAAAEAAAPARRLGGPLAAPAADGEGRVQLRVLLDGSALEVFTGSGEVLSSRLYRGSSPLGTDASNGSGGCRGGISVVAVGGAAVLERGAAWEMASCWAVDEDQG